MNVELSVPPVPSGHGSNRLWTALFIVAEIALVATLAVSVHASRDKDLYRLFYAYEPVASVQVFWGVSSLCSLFLLCASPFHFKRMGALAWLSFATAILSVLWSFLMHD